MSRLRDEIAALDRESAAAWRESPDRDDADEEMCGEPVVGPGSHPRRRSTWARCDLPSGHEGWHHAPGAPSLPAAMAHRQRNPIPLSTAYALVVDGQVVAKGSKRAMQRLQRERGGSIWRTSSQVGEQIANPGNGKVRRGYERTRMVEAEADTGERVRIGVPEDLPTNERAAVLRRLYDQHVHHPGGHWKGEAVAVVSRAVATDVREAMDFMGSVVDHEEALPGGMVRLFSRGYWAHGF